MKCLSIKTNINLGNNVPKILEFLSSHKTESQDKLIFIVHEHPLTFYDYTCVGSEGHLPRNYTLLEDRYKPIPPVLLCGCIETLRSAITAIESGELPRTICEYYPVYFVKSELLYLESLLELRELKHFYLSKEELEVYKCR